MIIQQQIKGGSHSFCKNIYTTQQYGQDSCDGSRKPKRKPYKPHKYIKPYKPNYIIEEPSEKPKKVWARRSNAKKPFLNRRKHVGQYHKDRTYKDTILCFICGQVGRMATHSPKRNNAYNREAKLTNNMDIDFIHTTDHMSDLESVYSMISEIDYRALDYEELEEQQEDNKINNFVDMI